MGIGERFAVMPNFTLRLSAMEVIEGHRRHRCRRRHGEANRGLEATGQEELDKGEEVGAGRQGRPSLGIG